MLGWHCRATCRAPCSRQPQVPCSPRIAVTTQRTHRQLFINCSSSGSGRHSSDDEPIDPEGHCYPLDEQQCCNKLQNCQQPDDALKSITGWDAEGLPKHHTSRRGVSNKVQLSVYPDAIGSNLADLAAFLDSEIKGSWQEVQQLADKYQLCMEFMTNHISPASQQFQDYVQQGDASPYRDMFVHWRDIWPQGAPSAEELAKVRTRKPAPPVIAVQLADGRVEPLWCTFSDQQVDIDPFSEKGWQFVESSLRSLCERGNARLLRLDAFGYVTKRAGTSCFMQEPEVWELLQRIKQVVKPYGTQLLCEVHEDFNLNIELARHGYWCYDFALPLLVLHALRFKTAEPLKLWLSICPRRQITTLDTHDGMGIDDVTGLAPLVDILEVEKCIIGHGGNINYKHFYVPGGQFEADCDERSGGTCKRSVKCLHDVADFLQPDCLHGCYKSTPHQYNETYFSAVDEDPKKYLLARAVQFFTPGVPMVFYTGLLAGRDDIHRVQETGSIREINRHQYSLKEAEQAARRPVVQALLQLCRFRNTHPAFRGRVYIDDSTPEAKLHVRWYTPDHWATLDADMQTQDFTIEFTAYDVSDSAMQSSPYLSIDSAGGSNIFCSDVMDLPSRAAIRHQVEQAAQISKNAAAAPAAHGGNGFAGDADADADAGNAMVHSSTDDSVPDGAVDAGSQQWMGAGDVHMQVQQAARTMPPAAAAEAGVLDAGRLVDQMVEDVKDKSHEGSSAGHNLAADSAAAAPEAASASDADGAAGGGMHSTGQMWQEQYSGELQQLDLSWAWLLLDKPSPEAIANSSIAREAVARAG